MNYLKLHLGVLLFVSSIGLHLLFFSLPIMPFFGVGGGTAPAILPVIAAATPVILEVVTPTIEAILEELPPDHNIEVFFKCKK